MLTALRDGHRVQLLEGGGEFFTALVLAIDASEVEVRMETYIFHIDTSGERIALALEQAAQRGVKVYMTADGVGTPGLSGDWAQRFRRCGVMWHVFMPLGRFGILFPSRWRRMHRKLCVVDGRIGFCGGINVLDDYVDPNHGELVQPRLDFAVRVQGPLVADMHQAMARLWWRQTLTQDVQPQYFAAVWRELQSTLRRSLRGVAGQDASRGRLAPDTSAVPGAVHLVPAALLLRDNLRNRREIERAYLAAISNARREIVVANAYFLPGARLRRALVLAAQRGVRVRLLLQGRYEYFLQYYASRPVYAAMLAAGVEIHEYAASFLHAKVAVVDGRWATVGSSNLDPLSLLLAHEANVEVRDEAFALALLARLELAMRSGGTMVDAAVFAARPWQQRAKESVAYALMRLALLLVGRRY